MALFEGCNSADPDASCTACFFRRKASLKLLLGEQVQVRLQLLIEILIELAPAKQGLYPREELGQHRFPYAFLLDRLDKPNRRAITPDMRPQFCASAASCLRPAAVIE